MEVYSWSQKLQECAIPYEEMTCKIKQPIKVKQWSFSYLDICTELAEFTEFYKAKIV